jgi:hypothetical protein
MCATDLGIGATAHHSTAVLCSVSGGPQCQCSSQRASVRLSQAKHAARAGCWLLRLKNTVLIENLSTERRQNFSCEGEAGDDGLWQRTRSRHWTRAPPLSAICPTSRGRGAAPALIPGTTNGADRGHRHQHHNRHQLS